MVLPGMKVTYSVAGLGDSSFLPQQGWTRSRSSGTSARWEAGRSTETSRLGHHIVHRGNGLRAADQPSREVDVSSEMQRKVRSQPLLEQRNGIGVRSLGDKCYRHPEYDQRFYHEGGLVAGSSFLRGTRPKHQCRKINSVKVDLIKDTKPLTSFKDKARIKEREELRDEVRKLTSQFEKVKLREELIDMKRELEEAKAGAKVADVRYQGGSGLELMKTYVTESLDALDDSDDE